MFLCKTSTHLNNCFTLLGQAERYIDVDSDSAILKIRKSLEALIEHMAFCSDIPKKQSAQTKNKLESLINKIYASNYFRDNYKQLKRSIKELQVRLNDGAHYNERLFVDYTEVKDSWVLLKNILQELIDNNFIDNLFLFGCSSIRKKVYNPDYVNYCKHHSIQKIRSQNYNEALSYLESGLRLADTNNEKLFFLYYIAYSYNGMAQYDTAKHFADIGYHMLNHEKGNNKALAFMSQIIRAMSQAGQHKECITIFNEYEYYLPSEFNKKEFSYFNNLGWLFVYLFKSLFHIGGIYEVEKSLEIMKKAIRIFERTKDHRGIALSYSNLGQVYTYYTNQHLSAISCFEKAKKYAKKINDNLILSTVEANFCVEYLARLDYEPTLKIQNRTIFSTHASDLIKSSIKQIKEMGLDNTTFIVDEYMHLAECKIALGDIFGAEKFINKSRKIMDAVGLEQDKRRSGRVLRIQANVLTQLPGVSTDTIIELFDHSSALTRTDFSRNHLESLIDKEKYLKSTGEFNQSSIDIIVDMAQKNHYPIYDQIIKSLKV